MKICVECGVTEQETKIYGAGIFGKPFCRKHYLQMKRHGKILKRTIYDPNEIRVEGAYAFIQLYDKKGVHIADTKIDTEFVEYCKNIKWYLRPNGYSFGTLNDVKIKLHTYVFEQCCKNKIPKNRILDHINGDRLDNTIENLRIVTQQENAQNMHKEGKTVGVNYNKWNGVYKWIPQIMVDGKGIWLGVYDTEEEAIKVRKEAEQKYFSINQKN